MLDALSRQLCTCLPEAEVEIVDDAVSLREGKVLVRAALESSLAEDSVWRAHADVTTTIVGEVASLPLETCVVGIGPSESAAIEQAAKTWFELVWALIYSLLKCTPQMEALHFHGHEPWAVPGAHGFVSPVFVRGNLDELPDAIASMPMFAGVEHMPNVFDGRPHLLKSIVHGRPGRFLARDRWDAYLELDGHDECIELPARRMGIAARSLVVVRYALCFPSDLERSVAT